MTEIVTIQNMVACGLCGGGLYLLTQLVRSMHEVRRIQTWPETTGLIIESGMCGKWSRIGWSFKFIWIEEPKVAYRYLVNGQEYIGHDIGPTAISTSSKRDAEEKIAPFPVGKDITVYYDPSKPQDSFLRKEAGLAAFAAIGAFGMILLTVGILALFGVIHLKT
jgi:hypothetical protein